MSAVNDSQLSESVVDDLDDDVDDESVESDGSEDHSDLILVKEAEAFEHAVKKTKRYHTEADKRASDVLGYSSASSFDNISNNFGQKCSVFDSYHTCQNILSKKDRKCWKCLKSSVCKVCFEETRRCNECFVKASNFHAKDFDLEPNEQDEYTGLFAVSSEDFELSPENNIFCYHLLLNHKFFVMFSSYTNQIPQLEDIWNMATMLMELKENGLCQIRFDELVAYHPDSRVKKLIPQYLCEQFKRNAIRCSIDAVEDYTVGKVPSGRCFTGCYYQFCSIQDVFANFKKLLARTGVAPETSVFVGSNGKLFFSDVISTLPGSSEELDHCDFPPKCACSQYEPPKFSGATMLVHFDCRKFEIGSGSRIWKVESGSCVVLGSEFKHRFLKSDVQNVPLKVFKVFIDKCIGYRQYHLNKQYSIGV